MYQARKHPGGGSKAAFPGAVDLPRCHHSSWAHNIAEQGCPAALQALCVIPSKNELLNKVELSTGVKPCSPVLLLQLTAVPALSAALATG